MIHIDPALYHGRPASGREAVEEAVYDFLDSLPVSYDRAEHEAADSMEDCLAIEQVLKAPICKNLFLTNRQKSSFYLLLMPGDKVFHTKDLSSQIGASRLSFAGPELMQALLGVQPGSVSVFGLQNDRDHRVRLLMDRDCLRHSRLGFHPCRNTTTLSVSVLDLKQKILPALGYEAAEVVL